jgi:hypothetical protein
MFLPRTASCVSCFGAVLIAAQLTHAQSQVSFSAPLRHTGHGFHEHIGVGWGFRHPGPNGIAFFDNGGFGHVPRFGGFDPNAHAHFGFGGRTGNLRWNFGIVAGQGSSRGVVSRSPSFVVPNFGTGFISSAVWRPFVTGFVPVVRGQPISPLQERLTRLRDNLKTQQPKKAEPPENPVKVAKTPATRQDDPPLVLKGNRD